MTILNEVNPPLNEVLEHHGVKGMHWGTRKAQVTTSGGSGTTKSTPSRREILDARDNFRMNTRAIRAQKKVARKTGDAKEAKKLSDMKAAFLRNPDTATAWRLTRGEKAAFIALGLVGTPAVAAGLAGGAAGRVHQRHKLERLQGTRA